MTSAESRNPGMAGPGSTPAVRVDERAVEVIAEALYCATYAGAEVEPWPDAWPDRTRMCRGRSAEILTALGAARGEVVWKPEPLRYSTSAHKVWYVGQSTVVVDQRGRANVHIVLGGRDQAVAGSSHDEPAAPSADELRALAAVILSAAAEIAATTEGGVRDE